MSKIILYISNDRRDKIYKTPTRVGNPLVGTFKDDVSIIRPVVNIECNPAEISGVNYMFIEDFHRYYFIDDITVTSNTTATIRGVVDPLYTYKDEIGACEGILERSQLDGEYYLDDPNLIEKASRTIRTVTFKNTGSTAYSDLSMILVTANTHDEA